jgi:hypothetical protein
MCGKLEREGESKRSIADIAEATAEARHDRGATTAAVEFLKDYLTRCGGTADSAAVKRDGEAAGHHLRTIERARCRIGIVFTPMDFPRRTDWSLPDWVDKPAPHPSGGGTGGTGATGL